MKCDSVGKKITHDVFSVFCCVSTRNAHMVHIKFNPIENGVHVYILVEVSF